MEVVPLITSMPGSTVSLTHLHAAFMAALPRIELHAQVYFRNVRCPGRKEDAIAETVALSWVWFVRLVQRGKNPSDFISTLATYAVRHVRAGRHLVGKEKARDALSSVAQKRKAFTVRSLFDTSFHNGNVFEEALRDNTRTPPAEQAAFRLDFPTWRCRRSDRDRRVIDALMMGERTQDVARRYAMSPGRISQLRADFCADWKQFCGEAASV